MQDDSRYLLPASYAQRRLWLVQQLDRNNGFYLVPMILRLRGALDVAALDRALRALVDRHESLRSNFAMVDGEVASRVAAHREVPLRVVDLADLPEAAAERAAARLAAAESRRPFDLEHDPLIRHGLVRLRADEHLLSLVTHHIAIDAWSQDVYFRELAELYSAMTSGREPALEPLPVQYGDFAIWQREWMHGEALSRQVRYWRDALDGCEPTELPTDHPRPAVADHRGALHTFQLPEDLTERLTRLAHGEQATLYMALLAVFTVVLARSTGRDDVVVGSPVAGRTRPELDNVVGFFVNSLVLRTSLAGQPTFREYLRRVRRTCLDGYDHQDVPFERVVEELDPPRDPGRNPLFQIMLVLQNAPAERIRLGDLELGYELVYNETAKFDLNVVLVQTPGQGVQCTFEYATALFEPDSMRRLADRVCTVARAVVEHPDRPVHAVPFLGADERRCLLDDWNDTGHPGLGQETLHGMFIECAARFPDRLAVVDGVRSLTYAELDVRSNRLAQHLRALGVGVESRVGICTRRDVDLMVAIYAVLKAGAAYVPLDPTYPSDRLTFMLVDSGARAVVTHDEFSAALPEELPVVRIDEDWDRIAEASAEPVESGATGGNACYVIYTSGSTGVPKGAVNEHAGLVNLMAWARHLFSDHELAGFSSTCSACFDFSVYEFFAPLSLGGTLVLAPDALRLAEGAATVPVRVLSTVPTVAAELLRAGQIPDDLQTAVLGGEALPAEVVRQVYARTGVTRIINNYGVTEASVTTANSFPDTDVQGRIPIGSPIFNTTLYVLDSDLRLLPVGVPGELYVAGVSLARCYVERPALSAERFVPNPYGRAGSRMYRTGDLVRWTARGEVEFLGRRDHQVKVRGYRIELGEVEAALRACPGVVDAAVTVHDSYLVGCYVGATEPAEVRAGLSQRVPRHLVPGRLLQLDELPRNASGKVDRAALPAPDQVPARPAVDAGAPEPGAPLDSVEAVVAEVWRDVLGVDRAGRHDNFFDLGGHSLLLMQVRSTLQERLDRPVEVVDLFRYPTVASLAAHLSGGASGAATRDGVEPTPDRPATRRRAGTREPLAIVGMSCRFPGAVGVEEFWENLCGGVESISTLSVAELVASGLAAEVVSAPGYVRRAGVVAGVDGFDAGFFGFSPREAELLDPQHRVFLECAVEALQRAGHDPARFEGAVGVYAGVGFGDYAWNNVAPGAHRLPGVSGLQLALALDKDYVATRVAYKLNLRGPAVSVQTACSTSLVAVHMAAQALLAGECDMALAGAAALFVPARGYPFVEGGVLSPDGHCRPFDEAARGTVPGSGVGVVVLRRLSEALADGDVVHAVLRGSAVNNDGAAKVGYTAPSVRGQAAVIRQALATADVSPESVQYLEGHGTATPLGDPIEVAALVEAFGGRGRVRPWCALGSVKGNVGHLDAAAGVAGLIKAVLAVERGVVPPSLHFRRGNPNIEFAGSPFFVAAERVGWSGSGPRRAGVSSFGMGGTNAHVVVEQAPERVRGGVGSVGGGRAEVVVLSAASAGALAVSGERLAGFLAGRPELALADVAWTLQVGRPGLAHRRVVVADDTAQAAQLLAAPANLELTSWHDDAAQPTSVTFLLDDDPDAESARRAAALGRALPGYWQHVLATCDRLPANLVRPVREALATGAVTAPAPVRRCAAFVAQYALAQSLRDAGVHPDALFGLGGALAGCLAGVFSLPDALALTAARDGGPDDGLGQLVRRVRTDAPRIPVLSAITAGWIGDAQATDSSFWIAEFTGRGTPDSAVGILAQDPTCQLVNLAGGRRANEVLAATRDAAAPMSCWPDGSADDVYRGFVTVLGRLWLLGVDIDWRAVHQPGRRRVILPTYPFERRRYWVEPPPPGEVDRREERVGRRGDISDWFYTASWRREPLVGVPDAGRVGSWLVVADADGLGARVADLLADTGQPVLRAVPGGPFGQRAPSVFTFDPGSAPDLERLLATLCGDAAGVPVGIVHCLAAVPGPRPDVRERAVYSVLYLARAIARRRHTAAVELTVLTCGGQAVAGEPVLVPEHGMTAGLCRVIPQEMPHVACRVVDVTPDGSVAAEERVANQVLAEISAPPTPVAVALRDGNRWVQEYQPIRLESAEPRLRQQGTYLIVGGLEGVGGAIGEYLARAASARLVVVHRRALPDRAAWDRWLAEHPATDLTSRRIRQVRALEDAGGSVLVLAADVADPPAIAGVIATAEARFGPLAGVVHSAGTVVEGSAVALDSGDAATYDRHLRSKVEGAPALAAALADRSLDFVLLNSSLSAVLGGFGYGLYAAANTYLDLFAHRQRRLTGVPWAAVNWEGWRTAAARGEEPLLGRDLVELALDGADGQEVLSRILAAGPPVQTVVSTGDLGHRLRQWVRDRWDADLPGGVASAGLGTRHARPELAVPYLAPRSETERRLAALWEELLGVDRIGVRDSFFDLGGHSLLAVHLVAQIRRVFAVALPLHTVVEASTVERLAEVIAAHDPGAAARTSVLVPLHGVARAGTYFWIHPLGGTALCYYDLARCLGPDVASYGLQAPALVEGVGRCPDVEELAARYIDEIARVRPDGPLRLGGWSAGGIIAVEMARQLTELGKRVEFVGVIDAYAPVPNRPVVLPDSELLPLLLDEPDLPAATLAAFPADLADRPAADRIALVAGWLRATASGSAADDEERRRLAELVLVARGVADATERFVPKPYPGAVHVYRAADATRSATDPSLGWASVVAEVRSHAVPGTHQTVLAEPNVRILAELVAAAG
ncbi:amino acid adenylation domain-containing protein [Plantactinospora sp. DSM 117369]